MDNKCEEKLVLNELRKLYKQVVDIAIYLGDTRNDEKSPVVCPIIDEILTEIDNIFSKINYINEEIHRLQ